MRKGANRCAFRRTNSCCGSGPNRSQIVHPSGCRSPSPQTFAGGPVSRSASPSAGQRSGFLWTYEMFSSQLIHHLDRSVSHVSNGEHLRRRELPQLQTNLVANFHNWNPPSPLMRRDDSASMTPRSRALRLSSAVSPRPPTDRASDRHSGAACHASPVRTHSSRARCC